MAASCELWGVLIELIVLFLPGIVARILFRSIKRGVVISLCSALLFILVGLVLGLPISYLLTLYPPFGSLSGDTRADCYFKLSLISGYVIANAVPICFFGIKINGDMLLKRYSRGNIRQNWRPFPKSSHVATTKNDRAGGGVNAQNDKI